MSDRDKKIILILLIVAVVALPYVFVIKDKRVETQTVKAQNIELQARLDYLNELEPRRDEFLKNTEANNKKRDEIIASFPADIRQENYTMFLLNTEYSSAIVGDNGESVLEYPIAIQSVTYGENVETPISDPESGTELNYTAISNASILGYQTFYPGFKHYLEYFMNYKDPMSYTSLTAEADPDTGIISGEIVLAQYAISGEGRELEAVDIAPDLDELELRGVEEKGVFGVPNQILPNADANAAAEQPADGVAPIDQQNPAVTQ